MSGRGRSVPGLGSVPSRERLLASAGALARLDDWQRITAAHRCSPDRLDGAVATRAFAALAADRLGTQRGIGSLDEAIEPAAYLELAQRLGRRAALREAQRPVGLDIVAPPRFTHPTDAVGREAPARLSMLARATLLHLDAHPGDNNTGVATAVGIRLESQASRHLRSLETAGFVRRTRAGRNNCWQLTDDGRALADRLRQTS